MVRWTRRLLIAVSVVIVLIGAVVVLLLTIDLGRFKGNLEDYVSDATGRQFVISGHFEPSIGTTIDIVAEDVRLANADWGVAGNILELERVVVSIDTWSLLSGPIDVLNLEVEGLTLHVEKEPETLQSSWTFGDAPTVPDDDESREPFELPLWLRQARLQRINVTYGQGWLDAPRSISVSHANLAADERGLLRMDLSAALGDLPIRADGFVGPLQALLDGRGPRWELEVTIGKFIATTEGSFRDLFSVEGPQIHAVMQGPFAERFLAVFGLPPLARGPVDITADLTESSEGIDLRVEGAFGDLTTKIVGRTKSLGTIGKGDLAVDVRGPNLQAIGKLFGAGFLPATAFAIDGALATSGDTLDLQSIVLSAGEARLEVDGELGSRAQEYARYVGPRFRAWSRGSSVDVSVGVRAPLLAALVDDSPKEEENPQADRGGRKLLPDVDRGDHVEVESVHSPGQESSRDQEPSDRPCNPPVDSAPYGLIFCETEGHGL